ncbi:hypothetical protein AYO44_03210 [Planctomycetaceae bacterium SCGC AG-212-F19]|nr:hypothetical protein AYO44_03210 [Planctomycetaceae bacterium SCGC AG-212-F19]
MARSRCWLALAAGLVAVSTALGWSFPWRPLQTLETALVFHPTPASESWVDPPEEMHVEDVWLTTPDGTRIHAWWAPVWTASGAILYCHGNAGNLSHRLGNIFRLSTMLGESVLIFDYPGYGKSDGAPSEGGCYAAGQAAYDWLTDNKRIPPEHIVLFGKSLGGGLATELALHRPHRALVLVKTFTSVPNMARRSWLTSASASMVHNEFDNLAKIGRCPGPVYVAHGDRDQVIPLAQGQQLFTAAPSPKRFFLLKGAGHNDPLPADFLADLAGFLAANKRN